MSSSPESVQFSEHAVTPNSEPTIRRLKYHDRDLGGFCGEALLVDGKVRVIKPVVQEMKVNRV